MPAQIRRPRRRSRRARGVAGRSFPATAPVAAFLLQRAARTEGFIAHGRLVRVCAADEAVIGMTIV